MGASCCCQEPLDMELQNHNNVINDEVEQLPSICGPLEARVRAHPRVAYKGGGRAGGYFLQQAFALVRHADRLDHTPEWDDYPDAKAYPNDTPLTQQGHVHATEVGQTLLQSGNKFDLVVASPYLRCAQTASRIAMELDVPVHFDLDLGEVFDNCAMCGVVAGVAQHRQPEILEAELLADFPAVEYIRDRDGKLKIEGCLQTFPESFEDARMRFCYKVKTLVQKSARELMSIVIVTHGDGVGAAVGMMKTKSQSRNVPYAGYAMFSRTFKVLERGDDKIIKDESLYRYEYEAQWKMVLSKGFALSPLEGKMSNVEIQKMHRAEIKAMEQMGLSIHTDYKLSPDKDRKVEASAVATVIDFPAEDKPATGATVNDIDCNSAEDPASAVATVIDFPAKDKPATGATINELGV